MAVQCPHCKYPNFADAELCRRCKKPLPRSCKECGSVIAPNASFCSKCGAIFNKDIDPSIYQTQSLRSRTFEEERAELSKQELVERSTGFQPKIHKLKKCPECWRNISEEAKFCTYCGTVFSEETDSKKPPTPSVSVRQPGAKPAPPKDAAKPTVKPAATPAPKPAATPVPKPTATQPSGKPVPTPKPIPTPVAAKSPSQTVVAAKPADLSPQPAVAIPPIESKDPPLPSPMPPMPEPTIKPSPAALKLDLQMIKVPAGLLLPLNNGKGAISVKAFYLSAAPITCAQYKVFCDDAKYPPPMDWIDDNPLPGKEDHPVILVSAIDAMNFCKWAGKRLPTSNEWALACRGNQKTKYPWGDDQEKFSLNCCDRGGKTTEPVMTYPEAKGPYGHLDMVGNVRQFVFDPTPAAQNDEGNGALPGTAGLAGSSYRDPIWIAAFGRVDFIKNPEEKYFMIGFRCAADL